MSDFQGDIKEKLIVHLQEKQGELKLLGITVEQAVILIIRTLSAQYKVKLQEHFNERSSYMFKQAIENPEQAVEELTSAELRAAFKEYEPVEVLKDSVAVKRIVEALLNGELSERISGASEQLEDPREIP